MIGFGEVPDFTEEDVLAIDPDALNAGSVPTAEEWAERSTTPLDAPTYEEGLRDPRWGHVFAEVDGVLPIPHPKRDDQPELTD